MPAVGLRLSVLLSVSLAIAGLAAPARAGGLDDFLGTLFGGGSRVQPQPPSDSSGPLGVTVRPHVRSRRVVRVVRAVRVARRREKPVNLAINPVEHPDWYLDDPTLRRGDIVVLDGRVLVFEGGRTPYGQDAFSSLGQSRLISKAERRAIGAMARLPADQPAADADPGTASRQASPPERE